MKSRVLAFAASLVLVAAATTALARNPWEGTPPYGGPMMTRAERKIYWKELTGRPTVEEREVYWRSHVEKMQQRALERGVQLPPPPKKLIPDREQPRRRERPPYFPEIMTEEEIQVYEETLKSLEDQAERHAFIAGHIEKMKARALARGLSIPSTADFADALKARAGADTVELEDAAAEPGEDEAELDEESEFLVDEDE